MDYSDDMDEEGIMATTTTLSKKVNGDGTKSIMRPSRKTAEEHNKSRAKMYAVANAATKNGEFHYGLAIMHLVICLIGR